MSENDRIRLTHMLEAAWEVTEFTLGQTRESLDSNQMLLRALSMSIGIIGEAASKVSDEVQDAYPNVPWTQIIGRRNRRIHGYFDIRRDRLWETATKAVPELAAELEQILSSADEP